MSLSPRAALAAPYRALVSQPIITEEKQKGKRSLSLVKGNLHRPVRFPGATNGSGCFDIGSNSIRPMRPTCIVCTRRYVAQRFHDRRVLAFSSTSFVREQSKHLPEHEYQVRIGAAIQVLRETLPCFMERGLVDCMPTENSSALLRVLKMGVPKRFSEPPGHLYHHNIHFTFQPAHATLPFGMISAMTTPQSPDKQEEDKTWSPCFSFHGRSAYFLGASVLRHTLHACFTEALIHLEHMQFQRKPPPVVESPNLAHPGDELIMRIRFSGTNRFSHSQQTYTIVSRYRFDKKTGTICEHIVDKMIPLPGEHVLRSVSGLASRLA